MYRHRGNALADQKMKARFPQLARERDIADREISRQRKIQLQQRELERQRNRQRYRGLGRWNVLKRVFWVRVFLPKGTNRTNPDLAVWAVPAWKADVASFQGHFFVSNIFRCYEIRGMRHWKRHRKQASHKVYLVILPTNQTYSSIFVIPLHWTNHVISKLIFLD